MLLSKFISYYCTHYIIPRILHIISRSVEVLIFYTDKHMAMGNNKNLRVFNFVITKIWCLQNIHPLQYTAKWSDVLNVWCHLWLCMILAPGIDLIFVCLTVTLVRASVTHKSESKHGSCRLGIFGIQAFTVRCCNYATLSEHFADIWR